PGPLLPSRPLQPLLARDRGRLRPSRSGRAQLPRHRTRRALLAPRGRGRSGAGGDDRRRGAVHDGSVTDGPNLRLAGEVLQQLLEDGGVPSHRVQLARAATDKLLRSAIAGQEDGSAYVITGDIPAMWLRDSTAQVVPLLALAPHVPGLADLVRGVLRT